MLTSSIPLPPRKTASMELSNSTTSNMEVVDRSNGRILGRHHREEATEAAIVGDIIVSQTEGASRKTDRNIATTFRIALHGF